MDKVNQAMEIFGLILILLSINQGIVDSEKSSILSFAFKNISKTKRSKKFQSLTTIVTVKFSILCRSKMCQ
jgi:hypothetical protein